MTKTTSLRIAKPATLLLAIGLVLACACEASAQAPPNEAHAYVSFFGVEVEFTACLSSDQQNCYAEFTIYRNPPGFTQNPVWDGPFYANQTSQTITDTQVKVGQSYTYQVCAGGPANSSRSNCITTNTVKLSTPPSPTPTPTPTPKPNPSNEHYCPSPWAPPQSLTVLASVSQIYLKWKNPTQPCPAFLTHIEVYRMDSTATMQPLAALTKAADGTWPDRYIDTGPLLPHTTYYYKVCESDPNQYQSNCATLSHGASTGGADPILTATRANGTTVKLQISVDQDVGISSLSVTREGSDDPCRQGGTLGNGLQGCRTVTTGPNGVPTSPAKIVTVYNWSNGASGGPTFSSKSTPYLAHIPDDTGVAPGVEYYYQAHVVWNSGEQDSTVVTVPSIYAIAPAPSKLTGGPKPVQKNGAPPQSPAAPSPAATPAAKRTAPAIAPVSPMKSPTPAASPTPSPPNKGS